MFCPRCGTEQTVKARRCTHCGAVLRRRWLPIVAGALVLVGGIAFAAIQLGTHYLSLARLNDRLEEAGGVDNSAEFQAFLDQRIGPGNLVLPSGEETTGSYLRLERESRDYAPRVVLSWLTWMQNPQYAADSAQVRQDFRYLGDLVVTYADSSGWRNDYYLYVTGSHAPSWGFTYDYETGELYAPQNYSLLKRLVREFGTLDFEAITSTEAGRDLLIKHGMAEVRHGKLEHTIDWLVAFTAEKSVHISDGEFHSHSY